MTLASVTMPALDPLQKAVQESTARYEGEEAEE
jgi:hypothetical protein